MTGGRRRVAVALLALLALPACGVPMDDAPRPLDPAAAPFQVFDPGAAPQPAGEVAAQLFLVRSGQVVPVQRQVPRPGSTRQVLQQLFDGPTDAERAAGLSTALPAGLRMADFQVRDRIAVVTLDGLGQQVTTDQVLAFAQIVATLVTRPQIEGVRFRARGGDLRVPRGDGSLTDAPVDRQSYAEQLGEPVASTAVPPEPVPPGGAPAPPPAPTGQPG